MRQRGPCEATSESAVLIVANEEILHIGDQNVANQRNTRNRPRDRRGQIAGDEPADCEVFAFQLQSRGANMAAKVSNRRMIQKIVGLGTPLCWYRNERRALRIDIEPVRLVPAHPDWRQRTQPFSRRSDAAAVETAACTSAGASPTRRDMAPCSTAWRRRARARVSPPSDTPAGSPHAR